MSMISIKPSARAYRSLAARISRDCKGGGESLLALFAQVLGAEPDVLVGLECVRQDRHVHVLLVAQCAEVLLERRPLVLR